MSAPPASPAAPAAAAAADAAAVPAPAPRRRRAARLLLALATLALLLGAAEAGLRIWSALYYPRLMAHDARLGWRHHAGRQKSFTNEDGEQQLVVQNEFGHRGPSHGLARRAGTRRVLVLGDSFTEAVQVGEEQLFTRLLELRMPGLEVLNTGVGAWGTVQQLLYLEHEGLRFRPDLVLLMAYENDLTDNLSAYSPGIGARPYAVLEDGALRIVEDYSDADFARFLAPVPWRTFLARESYLFYALNERVWQRLRREELHRLEDADRLALDPALAQRVFLLLVERLQALTQAGGARLAVALIPRKSTLQAGHSAWFDEAARQCEQRGIACLPLLDALAAATQAGRRCYFERDIHWTSEGHRVAAEALEPFLRARGP